MNRRDFLKLAAIVGFTPSTLLAAKEYQVPVLMYHDINNDPQDMYSVSPRVFAHQMHWLKQKGYRAIPLSRLEQAGEKDFVITFDDGYYSFIEHAQEVLAKHKFHATINVVGRWMSSAHPVIYDIKPRKAMHYGHLRELRKTGLVEIGCHTAGLHNLKKGVLQATRKELEDDFRYFNNNMLVHLDYEPNIIAWPFGRYNDLAIEVAKEFGYKYFLTSHYGKYSYNNDRIERLAIVKGRDFAGMIHA